MLESHTPTRGQAESSTLSSGISLGITHKHTQKAIGSWAMLLFLSIYVIDLVVSGSSEGSELSEEMSWPAFER